MAQFDCGSTLAKLMVPEVVSALGDVRELRGKVSSFSETSSDALATLVEVAKIQSASASNRIENISTSDRRLRELMLDRAEPRNRDEARDNGRQPRHEPANAGTHLVEAARRGRCREGRRREGNEVQDRQ